MGKSTLIEELEAEFTKKDIPEFEVGDTLSVHVNIVEGNKQRVQVFTGTVIAQQGSGPSASVTLHRVAYGLGMERLFLLHNPQIVKIERVRQGRVKRAKLNYLKGKTGKQAKVREKITGKKKSKAPAKEASAPKAKESQPEA